MKTKRKPSNRVRANCPDCGAVIMLDFRPELDDEIVCDECESNLIVVKTNPLKLDWAYEEDDDDEWEDSEDWDDSDDDDSDDDNDDDDDDEPNWDDDK